jgi:alanine racemase
LQQTTWDALKVLMRHRFVPSYYARDLLNKLQRLKQGTHTVEEYYQELQTGMLRCGLVENNDAAMARFLGGLNREIQDVLDYKEYTNITRLFHLACKAEREVQGRHARTQANSFAGRTTSFHSGPKPVAMSPPAAPSPPSSTPRDKAVAKHPAPLPATKGASFSGRTKDIQCAVKVLVT